MFEDELTTEADLAVGRVLAAGPGPEAAAALAEVDAKQLTAAGRLDAMAAWQAQVAWAEARTAGLLADHVTAAEHSLPAKSPATWQRMPTATGDSCSTKPTSCSAELTT